MFWHIVFGAESGLYALLSPTQLVLLVATITGLQGFLMYADATVRPCLTVAVVGLSVRADHPTRWCPSASLFASCFGSES